MADKGPVTIRSRKFIRNSLLARRQMVRAWTGLRAAEWVMTGRGGDSKLGVGCGAQGFVEWDAVCLVAVYRVVREGQKGGA